MPMVLSVMRTDSTSTYLPVPPAMDTYPFVLEMARELDPVCFMIAEFADIVSSPANVVVPMTSNVSDIVVGPVWLVSAFTVSESLAALSPMR